MTEDVRHPRETPFLIGHSENEAAFLAAEASGRLHHAWLITGPKGIGKATLAYRIARHMLAEEPMPGLLAETDTATSLDMDPDNPIFRRVASGAHGSLKVIEREWDPRKGTVQKEITVDAIRDLTGFFAQTAAEDGWRVAIIDAADELNRNAANALLKTLEEPPRKALILLVCNAPGRLPATVRSRCRTLALSQLSDSEVAAVIERSDIAPEPESLKLALTLAEGSPGRALDWAGEGGLASYRDFSEIVTALPGLEVENIHKLANSLVGKEAEARFGRFAELVDVILGRLIRGSARGETPEELGLPEPDLGRHLLQLADLDRWLEVWEKARETTNMARALNFDRRQVILNLCHQMQAVCQSPKPGA